MNKEVITEKQGIVIMVAFILGSTMVVGSANDAKQDVWIAILAAIVMVTPFFFIYARLLSIFPEKGLYEILDILFGKVFGTILAIPFIWYTFHLGSIVIRNFTEFIRIVSLFNTPQFFLVLFMVVLCIWAVRAGIEVIGRWTSIVLPVIIITVFLASLLFIPEIDLRSLKPVLFNGFKPVLDSAFSVASFPFGETVIFLMVLNNLRVKSSTYKVYYVSLAIGSVVILLITIRSLLTLGVQNAELLYFPTYVSSRLINIGDFIERIEILVTLVFIFVGFIKTNICLYAASCGVAKILKISNYRQIVAPIGLMMGLLACILYTNTLEMFNWTNIIYRYYAFPFQVILPIIIWVTAEIKLRMAKSKTLV